MKVTHRPRGMMCVNCKRTNCPDPTEFKTMRKIDVDSDGTIVVRCNNYCPVNQG